MMNTPDIYATTRKPPAPDTELARLVRALLAVESVFLDIARDDITKAENALFDARQALLDHMLHEHGLTKREVAMMGMVL